MPTKGYTTLALPGELVERIDEFVASNRWGYRSRGEVAAVAVREFLRQNADAPEPARERPPTARGKPRKA